MKRSLMLVFVAFATTMAVALAGGPAVAITNGQFDGDEHPNVGAIGCTTSEGVGDFAGNAELVSPTVAITAAHVIDYMLGPGDCQPSSLFVTFDPVFDPGTSKRVVVMDWAKHPRFNPTTAANDVGVLLLKKPVRGITPVQLPTEGLLDELKIAGAIQGESFVSVGYGVDMDCSGFPTTYPWCPWVDDWTRNFASVSYNGVDPDWIWLQMNTKATGEGGFCAGDSGGANFLGGPDSNLLVGVTSWASTCQSAGGAQRIDTPSVRSFLGRFVDLP